MDEASAILAGLLEQEANGRYVSSFQLGKVLLAMGDVPSALSRLERAFDDRSHSMVFLRVDPQLAALSTSRDIGVSSTPVEGAAS